jgi:restriction system protein
LFGITIAVVLIILGVIAFTVYKSKIQHKSIPATEDYDLRKIDINDIDKMADGSDFEMYLYRLLLELGYTQAIRQLEVETLEQMLSSLIVMDIEM